MIRWCFRVVAALCLTLLESGNASVSGEAHSKHRVKLEDLAIWKDVENLQLSPDGEMVAYALGGNVWLVSTKDGSGLRKVGAGTVPIWAPDGKQLAYYSSASCEYQLWVFDLETGRTQQLTNLQGGIDPDPVTRILGFPYEALLFSWSPDGTKLLFTSQVAVGPNSGEIQKGNASEGSSSRPGTPLVLSNETPFLWTLSNVFSHFSGRQTWAPWERCNVEPNGTASEPTKRTNQLFLVDIPSKLTRQLTTDGGGYFNPDWSPDGRKVVCSSSEGLPLLEGIKGWGSVPTDIYAIDPVSGEKSIITTNAGGDKRMPSWSPDGKWIAYMAGAYSGKQTVFVMPAVGGKVTDLTSNLDRQVVEFHWSPDSKSIIVVMLDGISSLILRVNTQTRGVERISGDQAAPRKYASVSRSGRLAWVESDGINGNVIRILRANASSSYVLIDLNPEVKEWELGAQEIVRWKNTRGDQLEGVLIKPTDYRKGRKYPLIVDCYPGLVNSFKALPMYGNQAWASRGYVVFFPAARAPHVWVNVFRTTSFMDAAKGPKGWDVTVDDVLSGVDELVRLGIVDPDRMGLYGFSNGGGVVDYLVTRTNRFKCAVSVAGVYPDWFRPLFLEFDSGVTAIAGGITPWDDPSGYVELSAVFHLTKVSTPMLLAAGDDDVHFLMGMVEMYNGLRWLGKQVILLRYPNQGHGFTGEALKDFWERENAFFDKYLKPGQPLN